MELVEGVTLGKWAKGREGWRERLQACIQAGEGLTAAHAAGIVHRDFKPTNVLVGDDGRVRVLDFGLARPESTTMRESEASGASAEPELTRTGVAVGTPAYMAPEQHLGVSGDAAVDVYALALSIYEVLYGVLPFASAKTMGELLLGKSKGNPPRPVDSDVPRGVYELIVRGLDPAPEKRWPSIPVFLTALRDQLRPRRRWAAFAAVAAIIGAGGIAWGLASPDETCADRAASARRDWAESRGAFESAIARDGLPESARRRALAAQDRYAQSWAEAFQTTCNETPSIAKRECLEDRRMAWNAAMKAVAGGAEGWRAHAVGLNRFASVKSCDDSSVEGEDPMPQDPQLRLQVRGVRDQLWSTIAKARMTGEVDLEELKALVERARALGHGPTVARALAFQGLFHMEGGHYEAAEQSLQQSYSAAQSGGNDRVAAIAAFNLAQVHALSQTSMEANAWIEHGRAASDRLGVVSVDTRWALDAHLSAALLELGRADEALRVLDPWLDGEPPAYETLSPDRRSLFWARRGSAHRSLKRSAEALDDFMRALQIAESYATPDSAALLSPLGNAAIALEMSEKHEEAIELHDRILAISSRVYPPGNAARVFYESNAGASLARDPERRDEGIALLTSVVEHARRDGPPIQVVYSEGALSDALLGSGRDAQALRAAHRAHIAAVELLGAEHPLTQQCAEQVAQCERRLKGAPQ